MRISLAVLISLTTLLACGEPPVYELSNGISVYGDPVPEKWRMEEALEVFNTWKRGELWRMERREFNKYLRDIEVTFVRRPMSVAGETVNGTYREGAIHLYYKAGACMTTTAFFHELGHFVSERLEGHPDGAHFNARLFGNTSISMELTTLIHLRSLEWHRRDDCEIYLED